MIKTSRKVQAVAVLQWALAPLWRVGLRLALAALQYSIPVRNARLDAVETAAGTAPIIEFRTGAPPANCAAAATGTLLAQASLPADWMSAAANGAKALLGTWSFAILAGIANQTIGYFRIYESLSPSICHVQGTVTATGGGGDMTVDNTNCSAGQTVTVNTFTLTGGNA